MTFFPDSATEPFLFPRHEFQKEIAAGPWGGAHFRFIFTFPPHFSGITTASAIRKACKRPYQQSACAEASAECPVEVKFAFVPFGNG
jgi:hypothetical protein